MPIGFATHTSKVPVLFGFQAGKSGPIDDGPVWAGAQTQTAVLSTLKTDKHNKRCGALPATPGAPHLEKPVRGKRMSTFNVVATRRALRFPGAKP